jgi:hypothetical protein
MVTHFPLPPDQALQTWPTNPPELAPFPRFEDNLWQFAQGVYICNIQTHSCVRLHILSFSCMNTKPSYCRGEIAVLNFRNFSAIPAIFPQFSAIFGGILRPQFSPLHIVNEAAVFKFNFFDAILDSAANLAGGCDWYVGGAELRDVCLGRGCGGLHLY